MQARCDLPTSYAPTLLSAVVGLQPRAIAVYGLGVVAKTVLAILDDFNVVGLMDKDPVNVGRILYGKVVLSDSSVRRQSVDLIIIAASDIYWRTISARIAPFCRVHGIRVLYMDGTLAALSEVSPTPPDIHQRGSRVAGPASAAAGSCARAAASRARGAAPGRRAARRRGARAGGRGRSRPWP